MKLRNVSLSLSTPFSLARFSGWDTSLPGAGRRQTCCAFLGAAAVINGARQAIAAMRNIRRRFIRDCRTRLQYTPQSQCPCERTMNKLIETLLPLRAHSYFVRFTPELCDEPQPTLFAKNVGANSAWEPSRCDRRPASEMQPSAPCAGSARGPSKRCRVSEHQRHLDRWHIRTRNSIQR